MVVKRKNSVTLDSSINQKQIQLYKKQRGLPKILSDEELSIFFDECDNYMYKIYNAKIYFPLYITPLLL